MRIPENTIDEILHKADIMDVLRAFHVELKRSGDNRYKACCPFHNERTPSFTINTSKQVYHCFGCGVGGGVVKLVQGLVNTDFIGAIRWLGDRYHVDIPEDSFSGTPQEYAESRKFRETGMRLLEDTAGFFQSNLSGPMGAQAREYLASRGITPETIQKYRIGYAPDSMDATHGWALKRGFSRELLVKTGIAIEKEGQNALHDRWRDRIIFPICDELSRVVGFSGRIYKESPLPGGKYVNSPESEFFHKGRILYGFNFARQEFKHSGWALICEGQLDVIACHNAGLGQAVAAQGTAFTEDHARMLARTGVKEARLAFDGDSAGLKATIRTTRLLLAAGLAVQVITLPEGADPDSIFRKGGAKSLNQVMEGATPAIEFAFNAITRTHPEGTPEAKSLIVSEMIQLLAAIPNQVASYGHCQELAGWLSIPEHIVADQLAKYKREEIEAATRSAQFQRADQAANAPRPAAVAPQALFHNLAGVDALAQTMLDLCIHFEQVAQQWVDLDVSDVLPTDSPVVRAINAILAATAEGDWGISVNEVAQGDLGTDSAVSAILTNSPFESFTVTDDGRLCASLEQAVNDCMARLERLRLEKEQQNIVKKLDKGEDLAALLRKTQELAKRKNGLLQQEENLLDDNANPV